ncbi:MAG: hypothetical protein IKH28_12000 [Lachnospiraceae bacterium]|nr:hypothetical protein [Lachnospiraceae bacterium]
MEKKDLDLLLKQSLTPDEKADPGLDLAIMESLKDSPFAGQRQEKRNARHWSKGLVAKVAAVALAVLVVGAGTTYAAGRILGMVAVRENRLAVGEGAETWVEQLSTPIPEELLNVQTGVKVMGGPNDLWVEKEEIVFDGVHTFNHTYPNYQTALSDAGFPNVFRTIPGTQESVVYQTVTYSVPGEEPFEGGRMICLKCNFGVGWYQLEQMPKPSEEPETVGVIAYSVPMTQSSNVRTYVSANGTEFTLVDDVEQGATLGKTVVMIDCEKMIGCLTLQGLTEGEIHQVLDAMDL